MSKINNKIKSFNIRVYGIAINSYNEILLTDEIRFGEKMTKFPGGGLKFGESTLECLKREFKEELKQKIEILSHFYTTDIFQPTYLLPETQQLISIYYLVRLCEPHSFNTKVIEFDFDSFKEGEQIFRWVNIKDLNENMLTFPLDKKVVKLLLEYKISNSKFLRFRQ